MKAIDLLNQQARERGMSEEKIRFAENFLRANCPGEADREIPEDQVASFLASSSACADMTDAELQRTVDMIMARRN